MADSSARHRLCYPQVVWQCALPDGCSRLPHAKTLERFLRHACNQLGIVLPKTVTVRFVTEEEALSLNQTFRQKNYVPNVLSFPQDATPSDDVVLNGVLEKHLGDVVLCWAIAEREARAAGKAPCAHGLHLVLHGFLHLLGYDHEKEAEATIMERAENVILATWGILPPHVLSASADN